MQQPQVHDSGGHWEIQLTPHTGTTWSLSSPSSDSRGQCRQEQTSHVSFDTGAVNGTRVILEHNAV